MRSFIERIRFALWFRRVQQHLVVLLDDEAWWQYEVSVVEHHRREFADLWLAGVDPWTAAENYYRELMVGEWACSLAATRASVWPWSKQTQTGQEHTERSASSFGSLPGTTPVGRAPEFCGRLIIPSRSWTRRRPRIREATTGSRSDE